MISSTAPDNGSVFLEYNADNLVEKVTSENGEATVLTYDEQRNLHTMELPDGGSARWSYNALGKVTGVTNPLGTLQAFSYDPLGRVEQIRQGDFNIVRLKYNAYEEVISAKDNHHEVAFEYTTLGSLKAAQKMG